MENAVNGEYRRLDCSGGIKFIYRLIRCEYRRKELRCIVIEQSNGREFILPMSNWDRLIPCDKNGNDLR